MQWQFMTDADTFDNVSCAFVRDRATSYLCVRLFRSGCPQQTEHSARTPIEVCAQFHIERQLN